MTKLHCKLGLVVASPAAVRIIIGIIVNVLVLVRFAGLGFGAHGLGQSSESESSSNVRALQPQGS